MNKSELKPNSEDLCIHASFQGRNCPKKKRAFRQSFLFFSLAFFNGLMGKEAPFHSLLIPFRAKEMIA